MEEVTLFCSKCGAEVYEGPVPVGEWVQVIHQAHRDDGVWDSNLSGVKCEAVEAHRSWYLVDGDKEE